MKRIAIITGMALLLGLAILFKLPPQPDPNAPRFVPGQVRSVRPSTTILYDWGAPVPFANGKVWIWAISSATNRHFFLYDLDTRLVVGELLNAGPVFCNRDQTKVLCEGHDSLETSLKQKVMGYIEKVSGGKIRLPKINRAETFWVLDLRDNSVRRVGELSQIQGTGSTWRPSPGFRYGCNVPNNADEGSAFFVCDLETGVFEKIKFQGDVQGWWDDSQILIRDPANNFVLFDVITRTTNTLFSANALANSLHQMDITNYPGQIRAINNWNGGDYDFYFALQSESYRAGESFLLKANHADPSLKLLYRNFKFEHLGRLDASATHYLYNGESGLPGRGGNGGVFLRDLSNNIDMVEVANKASERLSNYAGKIMVLEFWASWCGPCQAKMAKLQSYPGEYPNWHSNVVLIAASIDVTADIAAKHLKARGWNQTHNVWVEPPALRAYHVNAIPTVYVIGRQGEIVAVNPGDLSQVVSHELEGGRADAK